MNIHKIKIVDSTNAYLKALSSKKDLVNFTVVQADYQNSGKGQGTNSWFSDDGKNLLFSVLIKHSNIPVSKNIYINFAISIGLYNVLAEYVPLVNIKWPNDLFVNHQKICGILIENSLKGTLITQSVVGIGLNVNQIDFPKHLPKAISLKNILHKDTDRSVLLKKIIVSIQKQMAIFNSTSIEHLKEHYEHLLYQKNIFSMYKDLNNQSFSGKITGVSSSGMLQVELADGRIKSFANKHIIFL